MQTLRGLQNAQAHYDEIKAAFNRSPQEGVKMFEKYSELMYHSSINPPEQLMTIMDETLTMVEKHYDLSKKNGKELEFFKTAFDDGDACFPARYRRLQEYAMSHPLDGEKGINLDLLRQYSPFKTQQQNLQEALRVFGLCDQGKDISQNGNVSSYVAAAKEFILAELKDYKELAGIDEKTIEDTIRDFATNILCLDE